MDDKPEFVSLPEEYKSIVRQYKVEPSPFGYKDEEFKVRKGEEFVPLKIGDRGFFVGGCGPFIPLIVVYIDNEKGVVGFINPFVYNVEENKEYINIKIGKDMRDVDVRNANEEDLRVLSDKYKVMYFGQEDLALFEMGGGITIGFLPDTTLPKKFS